MFYVITRVLTIVIKLDVASQTCCPTVTLQEANQCSLTGRTLRR